MSYSAYVVCLSSGVLTASLNAHRHVVQELLQHLQALLQKHFSLLIFNHIVVSLGQWLKETKLLIT